MAKIKSEDLRLNIIVGSDKARKEMQDVQAAVNRDKAAVDALNRSYQQAVKQFGASSNSAKSLKASLDQTKSSLDANRKKHSELQNSISLENKSLAELLKHLRATRTALSNAVPDQRILQGSPKRSNPHQPVSVNSKGKVLQQAVSSDCCRCVKDTNSESKSRHDELVMCRNFSAD